MISAAAPTYPFLTADNAYADNVERQDMETRIQVILDAAVEAGCNHVVLSAFGCGAFCNPPEAVAEMFRVALAKSKLTEAVFCIKDDHNSRGNKRHNPRGNYLPFRE